LKKHQVSHIMDTVEENKSGFSQRQFERAKIARKLYHVVGSPTVEAFKAILKGNVIRNCPVTSEDVYLAQKIFGPAISALKGKTTRQTPKVVVSDEIAIPPELISKNRHIILCMDTMFVNEQPMLTTIDTTIRFRILVPLTSCRNDEYLRGLRAILRHYSKGGFFVHQINCDVKYKAIMDVVTDQLNIKMNYAKPGDHVPEAERNNRTIKERIRAAFHQLLYKALPKIMIRHLSMESTSKFNLFPAKGGKSNTATTWLNASARVATLVAAWVPV